MKINLNKNLLDKSNDILYQDENKTLPLTIKEVVISSLLAQTNEKVGGFSKHACYLTYKKIVDSADGEVQLSSEEITAIKALVDKYYTPIIIGQVYELFGE